MAGRPTSWQDVRTPGRPQFNGRSLGRRGGWRSFSGPTGGSGGSSGSGGGRGQANDYERSVANRAIEDNGDEGFNLFDAGGDALLKALDVLDTPRAAVVAGIYGQGDWDDWWANTSRNITFGEATGLQDSGAGGIAAGFIGDIALDPLTYVGGNLLHKPGPQAGRPAARKLMSPESVKFLGERAAEGKTFASAAEKAEFVTTEGTKLAQQGAQKALRFKSNQALTNLEREAIGATPGTFINLPGTGKIGRTLQIDHVLDAVTGGRFTAGEAGQRAVRLTRRELGAGKTLGYARAAVGESKFGSAVIDKFTKFPILRNQIIRGTPEDAAKAFMQLSSINAGQLQRRLFENTMGRQLDDVLREAKKAGVDGEDLWLAAGESADVVGPATARVEARSPGTTEKVRTLFSDLEKAANDISPNLPWLQNQKDYTPRMSSEEAAARRGSQYGAPTGGAGQKETFDMRRKFGPYEGQEDELFGQKLLTPEAHPKSWSVEQQISEILRNEGIPDWYNTNAYKSFPDYVRRLSKRYGEEYSYKQLRDAGFAESAMDRILTEKGLSQGQAKSAIYKMVTRSKQRAVTASVERQAAERELGSVVAAENATERAARSATRKFEKSKKELLDSTIATKNLPAIREWAEVNTKEATQLAVRRGEMLSERKLLEMTDQVTGSLQTAASKRLADETKRVYTHVTGLEGKISKMYDELADLYDRAAQLDGPTVDLVGAKKHLGERTQELEKNLDKLDEVGLAELQQLHDAADDPELFAVWAQENFQRQRFDVPDAESTGMTARIGELQGRLEEAEQVLGDMSRVVATRGTTDLDALKAQLAEVDGELAEAIMAGLEKELPDHFETLANIKGSLVHEIGVVERAQGRLVELGDPSVISAQMDLLRDAEALGDNMIHSFFPELPPEVHGSRVRQWAADRMNELQTAIDDTQGQILSAYSDRDTLRVELNDIQREKKAVERKLKQFDKKTSAKVDQINQERLALLQKAEEANTEAIGIEMNLAVYDQQAPGMVHETLQAAKEEGTAKQFLATLHAKRLQYEAKVATAEATQQGALKVAKTWEKIAKNNLSKDIETALELSLAHNYKQLGAVSMVKDEWMVEAMRTATVLRERGTVRSILDRYDKVLTLWKGYSLSTPGTVLRNIFGGVFNNYLAADVALADYKAFMQAHRAWETAAFAKLPKDVQEAYAGIRKAGLLTGGGTSLEIEKRLMSPKGTMNPLSTDFKYTRFFRNRQEDAENFLRGSLAMKVMREGGGVDDAIDSVIKFHFDYDDLSAAERSIARRVVPFYTWTRKNFPLMLEQIVQQPQKFTRFYQLKNEVELHSPEETIIPSYFTENMAVRLPFSFDGSRAYMLPDMPFTSLNDVTDPSIAVSQLSPFIKTPIEYMFGKQFFQGLPLRDSYTPVPKVMAAIPGIMPALNAVGKAERNSDGTWSMKQKDLYLVEQFLPSFGKARRLFPSEEKYSDRAATSWLSFVFGLGLRTNTEQDRRNELNRRVSREFENISTNSELGFLGENDKKPRYGQTVNAAYEMYGVEKDEEE